MTRHLVRSSTLIHNRLMRTTWRIDLSSDKGGPQGSVALSYRRRMIANQGFAAEQPWLQGNAYTSRLSK